MNANRNHANRPTPLTAVDHARQRAAIIRHNVAQRKAARREAVSQFLTICAAVGVVVFFFIRITSGA